MGFGDKHTNGYFACRLKAWMKLDFGLISGDVRALIWEQEIEWTLREGSPSMRCVKWFVWRKIIQLTTSIRTENIGGRYITFGKCSRRCVVVTEWGRIAGICKTQKLYRRFPYEFVLNYSGISIAAYERRQSELIPNGRHILTLKWVCYVDENEGSTR